MARVVASGVAVVVAIAGLGCSRPEPQTPLAAAAAAGDATRVAELIAAGAAVDETGGDGWSALVWASRRGHSEALSALLAAGADPAAFDRGRNRWPVLVHAVHHRQLGAVRLLLEAGADARAPTRGGATPLMFAAAYGSAEIARELLARGADPRSRTRDGVTALRNAMGGGWLFDFTDGPPLGRCHPAVVEVLLQAEPALELEDESWLRASRRLGGAGCQEAFSLLDSAGG